MSNYRECPNCQQLVHVSAHTCPKCGTKLEPLPGRVLSSSAETPNLSAYSDYYSRTRREVANIASHEVAAPLVPIVAGWIALAGAVAVTIGSFGPWIEVFAFFATITVNGTAGDGKITAALGVVAALLIFIRLKGGAPSWTMIVAILSLIMAGGIGIYHWNNMSSLISEAEGEDFAGLMTVGWGLQAITFGGMIGTTAAIASMIRNEAEA